MKIDNFRGDLPDISAKKEALVVLRKFIVLHIICRSAISWGFWTLPAVLPFWPNHRLGHPENYLFSLSKKIFSGSKYPKIKLFNVEKGSTGCLMLLWVEQLAVHEGQGIA